MQKKQLAMIHYSRIRKWLICHHWTYHKIFYDIITFSGSSGSNVNMGEGRASLPTS